MGQRATLAPHSQIKTSVGVPHSHVKSLHMDTCTHTHIHTASGNTLSGFAWWDKGARLTDCLLEGVLGPLAKLLELELP